LPKIHKIQYTKEQIPAPPRKDSKARRLDIILPAIHRKHQIHFILTFTLSIGVLKIALIHDGLARGLREASKALDRRQAHMCVLNEACEEEAYKKLVVALCSEHKIPLIKVPDGKQLGEWAGLCVLDREGNARKVVNCSCVVVKDWGEESQERSVLLNYFSSEQ
jgi:small subunit ribosomal protein S12e